MSSSSKTPTPATVTIVAVREEDLAAMLDFISIQRSVVVAAVPRHMYGIQAEARRQLLALTPILDRYKFAKDTIAVAADLANGENQKMLISQNALAPDTSEVANKGNLIKDEALNSLKNEDSESDTTTSTSSGDTVKQSHTTIPKKVWKPTTVRDQKLFKITLPTDAKKQTKATTANASLVVVPKQGANCAASIKKGTPASTTVPRRLKTPGPLGEAVNKHPVPGTASKRQRTDEAQPVERPIKKPATEQNSVQRRKKVEREQPPMLEGEFRPARPQPAPKVKHARRRAQDDDDLSLIQENFDQGCVLNVPRRKKPLVVGGL